MLFKNKVYEKQIIGILDEDIPWEKLCGSKILLTGASGMLGTVLVDTLMEWSKLYKGNLSIYAVARNQDMAKERFEDYWNNGFFHYIPMDVNCHIDLNIDFDYIIHAASNTHPRLYAEDPVGSLMTNIEGTKNVLNLAKKCKAKRSVFLSSVEIYGNPWNDEDIFDERYCGYIDCNTLRAAYPEGKRAGEALCQAFRDQYGLDIVIPRLSRVYGPTMRLSDSKAISQFILNAIKNENIVLKSEGKQRFSYIYVMDAVSAILTIFLKGENGEAYNVAGTSYPLQLRQIAKILAGIAGSNVKFELPNVIENKGFSVVKTAVLNTDKLQKLGWKDHYGMEVGLTETIQLLRNSK